MITVQKKYLFQGLIVSILCLAAFLRLYKLGENPAILNRDEAALAYNALLLQDTGRDEWNRVWPVGLESFGDYKLIGYPTILVGLFHFTAPSDFVVRLPAAVAGVVSILLLALIARAVVSDRKRTFIIGLIFAFSAPFLLFYSRIAFEANVAFMLLQFSLLTLLGSPQKGSSLMRWILLGASMIVACFTYNTPYILLPFLVVWIPFLMGVKNVKTWITPVLLLACIGTAFYFLLQPITNHKSGITIFSDPSVASEYPQYRAQFKGISQTLIGNKYTFFARIIGNNLVESFSYSFLVSRGGTHPWHQIPGSSHLTSSLYLLGLLGIFTTLYRFMYGLIKKPQSILQAWQTSEFGKSATLVYLTAISLAPASVTVDAPHATRSLLFLSIFIVYAVIGTSLLLDMLPRFFAKKQQQGAQIILAGIMVCLVVTSFGNYVTKYWSRYVSEQPALLQSNLQTVITDIDEKYPHKPVNFIDKTGYSYITVAWYEKLPATDFFTTIERKAKDPIGFSAGKRVGKYRFYRTKEEAVEDSQVIVEWSDTYQDWQVSGL
jgi:hypothetical protein